MSETTTTRAGSTYGDSHRKCYQKFKEKNLERIKVYYEQNKERIKERRRLRYASRRATTAAAVAAVPVEWVCEF